MASILVSIGAPDTEKGLHYHPTEDNTRRAFDGAAPTYDSDYEHLHGIQRLRTIIHRTYLRYFAGGQHLLELNCGTGTDAIALARKGMHVQATDVSSGMIAQTREKIRTAGLEQLVEVRVLSYHDLHQLVGTMFDGAYSNMGGLNCTDDLAGIAQNLASLVTPGGYFIATVMTNFCLWETLACASRLQLRNAFRRRQPNGVAARLQDGIVQTYYYAPGTFASAFAPYFDRMESQGLNIFTPPPNSTRAYAAAPTILNALEKFDDRISRLPVVSSAGDHFLMVLRRKDPDRKAGQDLP